MTIKSHFEPNLFFLLLQNINNDAFKIWTLLLFCTSVPDFLLVGQYNTQCQPKIIEWPSENSLLLWFKCEHLYLHCYCRSKMANRSVRLAKYRKVYIENHIFVRPNGKHNLFMNCSHSRSNKTSVACPRLLWPMGSCIHGTNSLQTKNKNKKMHALGLSLLFDCFQKSCNRNKLI